VNGEPDGSVSTGLPDPKQIECVYQLIDAAMKEPCCSLCADELSQLLVGQVQVIEVAEKRSDGGIELGIERASPQDIREPDQSGQAIYRRRPRPPTVGECRVPARTSSRISASPKQLSLKR
jgi:hypothetical protein